ncbi:MAG: glycosyltransferase N-terminal domain-containing protein [Vampirovibrionales bacterium]
MAQPRLDGPPVWRGQILVNGRLSPSSFAGYKRFGFFFKWMLAHLAGLWYKARPMPNGFGNWARYPQQLSVMGSVKYDGSPAYNPTTQTQPQALGITYGDLTPVVVLASSHRGEDAPFIENWSNPQGHQPPQTQGHYRAQAPRTL